MKPLEIPGIIFIVYFSNIVSLQRYFLTRTPKFWQASEILIKTGFKQCYEPSKVYYVMLLCFLKPGSSLNSILKDGDLCNGEGGQILKGFI